MFLASILIVFTMGVAEAKVFRNAYISFELPQESWDCKLEHTEWVCRSVDPKQSREAIIILTAKEVGPADSFEAYREHLKKPQPTAVKSGGQPQMSKVEFVKEYKIQEQPWIDSLHLASEVPHYYTRYLATIKEGIAVLVTLSAHKDVYSTYSAQFFKTVQSLRVIATKNLLADPKLGPIRGSGESLGGAISQTFSTDPLSLDSEAVGSTKSSSEKTKTFIIILAIILGAFGLYLVVRSKK